MGLPDPCTAKVKKSRAQNSITEGLARHICCSPLTFRREQASPFKIIAATCRLFHNAFELFFVKNHIKKNTFRAAVTLVLEQTCSALFTSERVSFQIYNLAHEVRFALADCIVVLVLACESSELRRERSCQQDGHVRRKVHWAKERTAKCRSNILLKAPSTRQCSKRS